MSITTITPIPLDIRKELSSYNFPLEFSGRIFNKMDSQVVQDVYKKVQVLPTDPEWGFIWRYFHNDKPNQYRIKSIYCINRIRQQQAFELNLSAIDREAKNFQPTWSREPRSTQREQVIELWQQTANIFSPFSIMKNDEIEHFEYAKIIPLWHISSKSVFNSGSESDFIYFGKIPESESQNNGYDFSENGIYFTNSARYASDIYNEKNLFLAWVAMKEPFPFFGDSKTDIENFKETYKDHNAYYAPVISINYSNNENPRCDEFVVFHKSQTLPRFYVELEVELPYVPSDTPQFVNELIPHIMQLLQNQNVDDDQDLRNYLCIELETLLTLKEHDYLEEKHKTMYEQLNQLLDPQGKVNKQITLALTGAPQASTVTSPFTQLTTTTSSLASLQPFSNEHSIPLSPIPTVQSQASTPIASITFGKADWEKYFGDIEQEPPLPANIEEILNASCSFWPNKKVRETHLLVLIPATVNREHFTTRYLQELIQNPKSGYSTTYAAYESNTLNRALKKKSYPSHWVLMTKDVIPDSKGKIRSKLLVMVDNHIRRTGLNYEFPNVLEAATSILTYYVKTGKKLYSDQPKTFIYTQDVNNHWVELVVGGFDSIGLHVLCHNHERSCTGVVGLLKF